MSSRSYMERRTISVELNQHTRQITLTRTLQYSLVDPTSTFTLHDKSCIQFKTYIGIYSRTPHLLPPFLSRSSNSLDLYLNPNPNPDLTTPVSFKLDVAYPNFASRGQFPSNWNCCTMVVGCVISVAWCKAGSISLDISGPTWRSMGLRDLVDWLLPGGGREVGDVAEWEGLRCSLEVRRSNTGRRDYLELIFD